MSLCSVAQPAATPPVSSGANSREPPHPAQRLLALRAQRRRVRVAAEQSRDTRRAPPRPRRRRAALRGRAASAGAPPCAWRATSRRCRARRSASPRPGRCGRGLCARGHRGRTAARGLAMNRAIPLAQALEQLVAHVRRRAARHRGTGASVSSRPRGGNSAKNYSLTLLESSRRPVSGVDAHRDDAVGRRRAASPARPSARAA